MRTIQYEATKDIVSADFRLKEAMNVASPSKRNQKTIENEEKKKPPSPSFIEGALSRMINQLDMITKTAHMMEQRMDMNDEKISDLRKQNGIGNPNAKKGEKTSKKNLSSVRKSLK